MLFSAAKTDLDINQITTFVEDRMIIKRNGNTGRLYYDYEKLEDGTSKRIEISPNRVYKVDSISNEYQMTSSVWYLNNGVEVACSIDDIEVNSFVYDDHGVIGIITNKSTTSISIMTILNPSQAVTWTDYK